MVMKRLIYAASVMVIFYGGICNAVSVVKNGSFENDGSMFLTPTHIPEYYCNVDFNDSGFSAFIDYDWSTHGSFSLTMYSDMFGSFEPNDAATISQSVYLADVSQLIFDVHLFATYGYPWDINVVTARLLIDGNDVWNSDGLAYTAGQFTGEVAVDINETFNDDSLHILSLQLRADVGDLQFVEYRAQWDFIVFSTFCSSLADFTGDCIIDINDLEILAAGWLDPNGPDLTGDDTVNFADFAVLANLWMSDGSSIGDPVWLEPDFVFLDEDLNDDGIVDYYDIELFSENWLAEGGACVRADLDGDGDIDLFDFNVLAESWQQTGDLYGL